jgi:cyclopropane fatty-acyl-phospholipid synthase-like methyltransferase
MLSQATGAPACRLCAAPLRDVFVDLGSSPLCESYRTAGQLNEPETFYPLDVWVCRACLLVQLQQYVPPEAIFTEYAYFSAVSRSWLEHARRYAEAMCAKLQLNAASKVVELGSNDGYLLQYFAQQNISVLGIEPARNVAAAARQRGVPTLEAFFGAEMAAEQAASTGQADLIVANNVLAQVPTLHDFVEGIRVLLAPRGTLTIEVPHLLRLVDENQFDTIYHEHFSYFSLQTLRRLLAEHDLTIFDVEPLPTHGGSLRIFAKHASETSQAVSARVVECDAEEAAAGMCELAFYTAFQTKVARLKRELLRFLIEARDNGQSVVGYGAPGKGNTLLNYCGVRTDLVDYTVDLNPYKQGLFLPGTRIPIHHPDRIFETHPDYVLILPWNIKDEIMAQMAGVRGWGGRFVTAVPSVNVY